MPRTTGPSDLLFCLCLLTSLAAGCGGGVPAASEGSAPKVGPHGGPLVPLPNASGFAEVTSEATAPPRKGGVGVMAVYFLGSDLKAPLATKPTGVGLKVRTPDQPDPVSVSLTPQPTSKDKLGSNRFASVPGPYLMDQLAGELSATVGGESVSAEFASER